MNTRIEHQIIKGADGIPLYVLVPYDQYMASKERPDEEVTLPNEVVKLAVLDDKGIVRAWREYLGLTQEDAAKRLGITQSAYAQMERRKGVMRYATRQRLAEAFGIEPEQLRM
jgi:DNA-binding XRE family transcriptional regulator